MNPWTTPISFRRSHGVSSRWPGKAPPPGGGSPVKRPAPNPPPPPLAPPPPGGWPQLSGVDGRACGIGHVHLLTAVGAELDAAAIRGEDGGAARAAGVHRASGGKAASLDSRPSPLEGQTMARAYSMQAVQHAALRAVALVREVLLAEVGWLPGPRRPGGPPLPASGGGPPLGTTGRPGPRGRGEGGPAGPSRHLLPRAGLQCREGHPGVLPVQPGGPPGVRLPGPAGAAPPAAAGRPGVVPPRASEFPLRQAQTRVGGVRYTTVGASVPARRVLAEVLGTRRLDLGEPRPARHGALTPSAQRHVLPW